MRKGEKQGTAAEEQQHAATTTGVPSCSNLSTNGDDGNTSSSHDVGEKTCLYVEPGTGSSPEVNLRVDDVFIVLPITTFLFLEIKDKIDDRNL